MDARERQALTRQSWNHTTHSWMSTPRTVRQRLVITEWVELSNLVEARDKRQCFIHSSLTSNVNLQMIKAWKNKETYNCNLYLNLHFRVEGGVHFIDCLLSMHWAQSQLSIKLSREMIHGSNPSTSVVNAEASEVQDHPGLCNGFEFWQGCMRPCLKSKQQPQNKTIMFKPGGNLSSTNHT